MVGWVASLVTLPTVQLQSYRTLSSDFSCQTIVLCSVFCVVLIHTFRCNDDD